MSDKAVQSLHGFLERTKNLFEKQEACTKTYDTVLRELEVALTSLREKLLQVDTNPNSLQAVSKTCGELRQKNPHKKLFAATSALHQEIRNLCDKVSPFLAGACLHNITLVWLEFFPVEHSALFVFTYSLLRRS
jgi:hypothetical protein